jgi:hypothetical protein
MELTPAEAAVVCQVFKDAKIDTDGGGKNLGAHAEVLYNRFLACAKRQPEPRCPHKWVDEAGSPVCEYCGARATVTA